jgi:hypothetical protein
MHGARAVDAFTTARLTIVPATPELVDLELAGADRLAEALRADLPDEWPPEHHDADVLRFVRAELDEPSAAGWWLHYLVLDEEGGRVLVGTAGFKGPPAEGVSRSGIPSSRPGSVAGSRPRPAGRSSSGRGARVPTSYSPMRSHSSSRRSGCSASSASRQPGSPSRASSGSRSDAGRREPAVAGAPASLL